MPKLYVVNLYAHEDFDPDDVFSRIYCVADSYDEAIKRGEKVWESSVAEGYVVEAYPLIRVNGYRIELVKEG